jgi:hypothetical protein
MEDCNGTVCKLYGKCVCGLKEILLHGYNVDVTLYECDVGSIVKYGRYEHMNLLSVLGFLIC